jgi:hypothetical protein
MKPPASNNKLVSFLSGASWAFTVVGVWVTFQSFLFLGWFNALLFTFLFLFLAFLILSLLDHIILSREHYEETLKQTAILEEIRENSNNAFSREHFLVQTEFLPSHLSS